MVRLYRFYNWAARGGLGHYGEPFALCDECKAQQPVPETCILNLIANESLDPCIKCGRKAK